MSFFGQVGQWLGRVTWKLETMGTNPTRDNFLFGIEKLSFNRSYSHIILSFHQSSTSHVKRQRHCNIIWFNPPYSRAVITSVAKKFLQLIDLHFLPLNKFHKIFNRNNVKVSYCCTQNVGNIIKSHNKKLINSSNGGAMV